jgi:hypothetical protein
VTEARAAWLASVEQFTFKTRAARAGRHAETALQRLQACRCVTAEDGRAHYDQDTGEVTTRRLGVRWTCLHKSSSAWHEARAKGQWHRFERVAACGDSVVRIYCGPCKRVHKEKRSECCEHRTCIRCRGIRAHALRARFKVARERSLKSLSHRSGQRWAETFLTLTWPDSGDPAADTTAISAAFPGFVKRVRDWLWDTGRVRHKLVTRGKREVRDLFPFLRVLEATPGAGNGHAHLHCWFYSPYVPHELARLWWAECMPAEARARLPTRPLAAVLAASDARDRKHIEAHAPGDSVPWPVLDIRACHGDPGKELVKYLVKDLERGEHVDPETFARLFDALEGHRMCATSVGFWMQPEPVQCKGCGTVGGMEVQHLPQQWLNHHPQPVRAGPGG